MSHPLVESAKIFAIAAHSAKGQVRKYTNEPYWKHPERVASVVEKFDGTPEQIAAAWLHDVVEDTDIDICLIESMFGKDVASLVNDLTDVSNLSDGIRSQRKKIDRIHASSATPEAKTIKLSDVFDNIKSIHKHDPKFAKIYLEEKRLLLKVLKEGNRDLYIIVEELITSLIEDF